MPYIPEVRRKAIFGDSLTDYDTDINNCGELNYFLTYVLLEYANHKGHSYQTYNDISGAVTECLAEFRRRVIVPYEKKKCKSAGDVY